MLDRLEARADLAAGATVVMDRGLASAEAIALLKKRQLHYVVAGRQSERERWLATFADEVGFTPVIRQPSPTNPKQNKSRVDVQLVPGQGCTYVLCRSEQRIAKDKAIREKHEQRLLADVEKLRTRIADGRLTKANKIGEAIGRIKERYPRVTRFYHLTYDATTNSLSHQRVDAKYQTAQQLDGTYLLQTDRTDLSADEAWRIYSLLTRAEDAFRDMTTPLAERPIFHHLQHRVESHLFLYLLAYDLPVALDKSLLDQGIHTSGATVRDTLKTHQVCTIVLPTTDGKCLRIRKAATPDPEVRDLYARLDIPQQLIKPTHSWSDASADV